MRTLKIFASLALLLVVGVGVYFYLNQTVGPKADPAIQQASDAFLKERGQPAADKQPSVAGNTPTSGDVPPQVGDNAPISGKAPPQISGDAPPQVGGNAPSNGNASAPNSGNIPPISGNVPPPGAINTGGMPEPVIGKVERVEDNSIVLNAEDGSSKMMHIVDTSILQTLVEIKLSDIKQGDRVMIFGKRDGERFRAAQVRLVRGKEGFMGGGLAIDTGEAVNPQAPPEPINGLVERVDSDSFVITNPDTKANTTVQLIDSGKIIKQQNIQLSDLQPGDALMTMGVKDGDGYKVIQAIKVFKL